MKTTLDCIPCTFRQALDAARRATDDRDIHERVLREAAKIVATCDLGTPPPVIAGMVHRRLRELTGSPDPYLADRRSQNALAKSRLPGLRRLVDSSEDPLEMAVRVAIAGNVIDLGVGDGFAATDLDKAITQAVNEPLIGDYMRFRDLAERAVNILYLADNAGEIVFDRLLIEALGPGRVTVVVRGAPVINDAVYSDAKEAGLTDIAAVIDNGSDAPGTILDDCSDEFRRLFSESDMVIAKGQGNFETLNDSDRCIAFLFKVKCAVVAELTGLPHGSHVLLTKEKP